MGLVPATTREGFRGAIRAHPPAPRRRLGIQTTHPAAEERPGSVQIRFTIGQIPVQPRRPPTRIPPSPASIRIRSWLPARSRCGAVVRRAVQRSWSRWTARNSASGTPLVVGERLGSRKRLRNHTSKAAAALVFLFQCAAQPVVRQVRRHADRRRIESRRREVHVKISQVPASGARRGSPASGAGSGGEGTTGDNPVRLGEHIGKDPFPSRGLPRRGQEYRQQHQDQGAPQGVCCELGGGGTAARRLARTRVTRRPP